METAAVWGTKAGAAATVAVVTVESIAAVADIDSGVDSAAGSSDSSPSAVECSFPPASRLA